MRVLICYDQDVPSELIRDALTVGKALMENGHTVVYAVGDPVTFVDYAGSWTPNELHQAPVLHAPPHLVMKRAPVDGFADQMAAAGYDDKQTLMTLTSVWHRQLDMLKPDVIVGFSTPVLWLVGQFYAPTVALGNGMALPPVLGTSFPRLSVDSAPLADEAMMLANANATLARFGHPSLAALSDVIAGCTSILYGLPTFDPYLQLRRSVTAGLLGEQPSPIVPPAEQRLAVSLDVHCPGIEMIILAVAGFDQIPLDIHVSGATTSMRRFLEQHPHITVWNEHAALLEQAVKASALVHHGVQDVAQRCLCLGRPQLIIPWTREQEILNYMVGWMAFSWMKPPTISIEEMAGTLRDLLRDSSLGVAAHHHARQLANANIPDALPDIIERIERLARPAESARPVVTPFVSKALTVAS
ncbi:MAG TPA: hypothetical protein VJR58_32380 [Vineibacter sp.]|nr:hypothetical protein [Vineibacter sp.]